MIPEVGAPCGLCTPAYHYRLTCACGHGWDEPAHQGPYLCPRCGREHVVTEREHDAWVRGLPESAVLPS